MDEFDLASHRPSEAARRRAEAAGLDLERLKRDEPTTYAMLNAQGVMTAASPLEGRAGELFFTLFPNHQLFSLPSQDNQNKNVLLVFPPLSQEELRRLDEAFGKLVVQQDLTEQHVYYRVVNDVRGERRELALPFSPNDWNEEADVMVGPFASRNDAAAWSEATVSPASGLVSDVLPYGDAWFCDVFEGE